MNRTNGFPVKKYIKEKGKRKRMKNKKDDENKRL